jgi:hypothetical protein
MICFQEVNIFTTYSFRSRTVWNNDLFHMKQFGPI